MRLIYICFLVLLPLAVSSQEETFYIQFDDQSVAEAFTKIEDTYDVLFSYKDADISNKSISLKREMRSLTQVLDAFKLRTKLDYKIVDNRYIIINQFEQQNIAINELDNVIIRSYLTKGIKKTLTALISSHHLDLAFCLVLQSQMFWRVYSCSQAF